MAQPNVSQLETAFRTATYISSGKPIHIAGVLQNHPAESNEIDTIISMAFSQDSTLVVPGQLVNTWETNGRFIEPYTMDAVGGLASAAAGAAQTFKMIQDSTDSLGTLSRVRVGEILVNPVTGRSAYVDSYVINGVDDVDITVRGIGAARWITAGTTMPAGQTLMPMGIDVAEVSDTVENMRTDWNVYQFGLTESRESDHISGRTLAGNLTWVGGEDGGEGLYISSQLMNMMKLQRQFLNRKMIFAEPDNSTRNAINAGFNAIGMCGIIPFILGRSSHPGGINRPHGGTPSLAWIQALIRDFDQVDTNNVEWIMAYDREFSMAWSNMIKNQGGTFDLWPIGGIGSGDMKGVNMNFNTLEYQGFKFHGKNVAIFNNGAGLNVTGGLVKNFCVGFPRKMVYDSIMSADIPAVRILHAGSGKGYNRSKNMWAYGNPNLLSQIPGGANAGAGKFLTGASGKDEINLELQYEQGIAYAGMFDSFVAGAQ